MIADPYDATQATTAGAPLAGLQIRLESIPDMNYDALGEPPQGEVLMRGPAVFSAYHKRDDLTAEVKSAALRVACRSACLRTDRAPVMG